MTVNRDNAMTASRFENISYKNADGTPMRCKRTGKTKTWKTRPDDFRIPVKHGLKDCFYITPENADRWNVVL